MTVTINPGDTYQLATIGHCFAVRVNGGKYQRISEDFARQLSGTEEMGSDPDFDALMASVEGKSLS